VQRSARRPPLLAPRPWPEDDRCGPERQLSGAPTARSPHIPGPILAPAAAAAAAAALLQISGKQIHLSLVANPSHLEAVNTVVLGKTRAKQYYSDDHDRSANMGILLHGDGAFSGQGGWG
jgi:hypothetical protein